MNTDTTDRSPLDDVLMAQVRDLLDTVDATEAARPTTMPPWARIHDGMDRARRRRRRGKAVRVATGLFALTAVGAATFSGVVPYPSFAPTVAIPGTGGQSALDDGHTRGSLGSDALWLKAFRDQVASGETVHEDGGEFWGPPAAGKVSVLFAGDVGDYRVALVEGDWHWGPIGARQQVWFMGPAGAPAAEMTKGGNGEPVDTPSSVLNPNNLGAGTANTSAVVVLSARATDVRLIGPPTVDASGRVHPHEQVLKASDGVYQVAVRGAGFYTLKVAGQVEDYPFQAGAGNEDVLIPRQSPLRGGPAEGGSGDDGKALAGLAQEAWGTARQTVGGFQVLASEPDYRGTGTYPVRAVVGQVTLPGGARIIAAGQVTDGGANVDSDGAKYMSWLDVAQLLPAGTSDDVTTAWRVPSGSNVGGYGPATTTGWTAAMGPVGTTAVQWVHRDGPVTTTDARNTLAVTEQDDVRSVRFLDADGHRIGSADVREPLASNRWADPRMDTPWVLPQIAAIYGDGLMRP